MTGSCRTCMYRSISLLLQRLIILMVLLSNSEQERHGTCGTETSNGDILEFKSQVWAIELNGDIEDLRYHCGHYVFTPPHWRHEAD